MAAPSSPNLMGKQNQREPGIGKVLLKVPGFETELKRWSLAVAAAIWKRQNGRTKRICLQEPDLRGK
jgi:hypothetical protein